MSPYFPHCILTPSIKSIAMTTGKTVYNCLIKKSTVGSKITIACHQQLIFGLPISVHSCKGWTELCRLFSHVIRQSN